VNVINVLRLLCRDEIIVHRLKIWYTYLTRGHLGYRLLTRLPQCLACQIELTGEHRPILLHCLSFTNVRDDFSSATLTSMPELFVTSCSIGLIDFVKETGFYRKI